MTSRDTPLDCACFNTRKAARLLGQVYDRALEPSGLKNTQFTALWVADELGPLPITELAEAMGVERTTLTRNLQVLERDGLVRLESGPDARSKLVVVTKEGKRLAELALPLWASAQQRVTKTFGVKRWANLRNELDALQIDLQT